MSDDATVVLRLSKADAQELFGNLNDWSDDWERNEGERIPLYDRACTALQAALAAPAADALETITLPNGRYEFREIITKYAAASHNSGMMWVEARLSPDKANAEKAARLQNTHETRAANLGRTINDIIGIENEPEQEDAAPAADAGTGEQVNIAQFHQQLSRVVYLAGEKEKHADRGETHKYMQFSGQLADARDDLAKIAAAMSCAGSQADGGEN